MICICRYKKIPRRIPPDAVSVKYDRLDNYPHRRLPLATLQLLARQESNACLSECMTRAASEVTIGPVAQILRISGP